jgi:hypothetical protein
LVARLQISGDQIVLAAEVIVESASSDLPCLRRYRH